MSFLGIALRRPRFWEVTAAAIMAAGLWVAIVGLTKVSGLPLSKKDAGALMLVLTWGAVSTRMGVRIGQGMNHLAANVIVSALLLGAYQFFISL